MIPSAVDGSARKFAVFIAHPSHLLTNHLSHGDGLTAYGFISELARRDHVLHVSVDRRDLTVSFPPNVVLHDHKRYFRKGLLSRLEYMVRVRSLYRRLARRTSFDLIHQMNPVYLGLSLAFLGSRVPIVLGTYIGDWPSTTEGFLSTLKLRVRQSLAFVQQQMAATLLVTTHEAALSRIASPTAFASKTFLVRHGINVDVFQPADASVKALSSRRVLFVGNLHVKKGIFELIQAIKLLEKRMPDVRLIVAGDGPERAAVSSLIDSLELGAKVDLVGNVSRDALPSLLQSGALLCCPSHGEPLGMVAIEAMASGLPIVATRAGGLGELINDRSGLLVAVGAPEELADAIERLLLKEKLSAVIGANNRDRALKEFAWPAVVDALERVYTVATQRLVEV